jgi:hypothetical protein
MFEFIISYKNLFTEPGGAVNEGDDPINGISTLSL